jgi:inosose dehydratase
VKDRLAERMTKWADAAATAKVVVAVKPHVANALHTVEAAKWLIGRVNSPWLRLAFDASHFQLRGVAPETAAAELGPLAAFAHVKDAKGTPDKFEFLLPGDAGTTDYPALAGALAKAGYAGPVVVEVSALLFNRPGFDPVAAAKRSFANLALAFGGRPR